MKYGVKSEISKTMKTSKGKETRQKEPERERERDSGEPPLLLCIVTYSNRRRTQQLYLKENEKRKEEMRPCLFMHSICLKT